MASNITQIEDLIKSSSNDLEALEGILEGIKDTMDDLKDAYESGAKGVEDYNASMLQLSRLYDNVVDKQKELIQKEKEQEEAIERQKAKIKEYETAYGKLGAEANTALGIISTMLKDTNPAISAVIGSVQKLIPNIAECAKMFNKVGLQAMQAGTKVSALGKIIKVAMSPTGIMMAITAIVSLISVIDNVRKKHEEAAAKAKEHAEAEKKAAQESADAWNSLMDDVDSYLNPKTQKDRIIGRLEEAKAEREYTKALLEGIEARRGLSTEEKKRLEEQKKAIKDLEDKIEAVKNKKEGGGKTGSVVKPEEILNSSDWKNAIAKASDMIDSDIDGIMLQMFGFVSEKMDSEDYNTILEEVLGITDKKKKEAEQAFKDIVLGISDNDLSDLDAGMNSIAEGIMNEQNAQIKAEQDQYNARIDNYKNFLDTYSSLSNTITDAISKNLEAELQAGKISEREYKRKKKVLQAFSIASIVASAASGLMDTWTGYAAETKTNAKATDPITMAALNAKSLAAAIAKSALITTTAVTSIGSVKSESISSATPTSVSTPAPTINYVSNPSFQESADAAKQTADTVSQVADNTAQSNVVPVLVVESLDKVQKHMTSVQTNSSF